MGRRKDQMPKTDGRKTWHGSREGKGAMSSARGNFFPFVADPAGAKENQQRPTRKQKITKKKRTSLSMGDSLFICAWLMEAQARIARTVPNYGGQTDMAPGALVGAYPVLAGSGRSGLASPIIATRPMIN